METVEKYECETAQKRRQSLGSDFAGRCRLARNRRDEDVSKGAPACVPRSRPETVGSVQGFARTPTNSGPDKTPYNETRTKGKNPENKQQR